MAKRAYRGLDKHQEQKASELIRDTRTLIDKFSAFLGNARNTAILIIILSFLPLFLPELLELTLIANLCLAFLSLNKKTTLPYRLPMTSGILDYNDLGPTGKPKKASGIAYFGNEKGSKDELWFNDGDMRTHVLIFGSTGAGKTEVLKSIVCNALIQGSGFIYIDGKGDNALFAGIFSMCRNMGREDDLLIINFMTGARDIVGAQEDRISNTINPFSFGSSGMVTNLIVSLMGDDDKGGDMWKGRAISFVEALIKLLVYMRDRGDLLLDANTIRLYFVLTKLESMVLDKKFPVGEDKFVDISDAPKLVMDPLFNYLESLPGFQAANKGKQENTVWEQHGYIIMQLTRIFSSLADTYGHILRTRLAEVDFKDVVLNRRIMVVLLPALEKSPDELAQLGKIIIAALKGMMAAGLGERVEGTHRQVIERKPTTAPTPFMCVMDEYGYYAVKGFAVVPAQARSLGFCAIFAGQDLPAFQKASKEEAASIGANTNIKICMKLEDPADTWEFFQKTAGQAYVTRTSGFQAGSESMTGTYKDTKSTQVEKQDRIDLADLKDQEPGEAHIFFKSNIVRAQMFYANPAPAPRLKVNQFLKIDAPSDEIKKREVEKIKKIKLLIDNKVTLVKAAPLDEDLQKIVDKINELDNSASMPQYISLVKELDTQLNQEAIDDETESLSFNGIDIFKPNANNEAILSKKTIRYHIEKIERLFEYNKKQSQELANTILEQIHIATLYPEEFMKIETLSNQSISNTIDKLMTSTSKEPA